LNFKITVAKLSIHFFGIAPPWIGHKISKRG
jgi:hypothetical protein